MKAKQIYRIRNWSEYNKALVERGSLTLWFDEASITPWYNMQITGERGRPRYYADIAILCMLTVKMVFKIPLRATQGMVASLINLLDLPIEAANYSTLSRRQGQLTVSLKKFETKRALHVVVDSTGLKVFGEGEWKVRQHGYSKRRTWRKLGAYDHWESDPLLTQRGANAIIPPRRNAKIIQHGNAKLPPLPRDENLRHIRQLGRAKWKKENHYHRRSLAETTMSRFKQILGDGLSAIGMENQCVEAFIKCNIVNKMTAPGMPDSYLLTA